MQYCANPSSCVSLFASISVAFKYKPKMVIDYRAAVSVTLNSSIRSSPKSIPLLKYKSANETTLAPGWFLKHDFILFANGDLCDTHTSLVFSVVFQKHV